jgi:hypothetical protein
LLYIIAFSLLVPPKRILGVLCSFVIRTHGHAWTNHI